MRIPNFLEKACQKIVDKYDEQNMLKSRSQAFNELVSNNLELVHLKLNIIELDLDPERYPEGELRSVIESGDHMPKFDVGLPAPVLAMDAA